MTFKEALTDDLECEGGFFDIEEFAEEHDIDGKTIPCIIQHVDLAHAGATYGLMKMTVNPKELAVNKEVMLIFARTADVREKITANSRMDVDGARKYVRSVKRFIGYVRIEVGDNMV